MMKIDMWYSDKKEQATGLDIQFNDLGCFYSGNIRIFGGMLTFGITLIPFMLR